MGIDQGDRVVGGSRQHRRLAGVVGALLALATVLGGGAVVGGAPTDATDATTTTTTTTTTTAPNPDWPMYGHDYANTRFSATETRINRANVGHLVQKWSVNGVVGVTGTPVVAEGIAYFGDWTGAVHAVHANNGRPIWTTMVGGWIVGAVALDATHVFASSGHTLFGLDRTTGKLTWSSIVNDHPLAQINASPIVVDGLVLQGVASAEVVGAHPHYTFRGSIGAYSAKTGKQKWRFYTTPNNATAGPGVGIWSTPAIDLARGLLYVGTGNAYDEPTGPLADSIIALDFRTGKLKWHRQFTYPDVWSGSHPKGKDADVGASPNLWTANGHDLVGAGDKAGRYHAVDRDTGKLVWQTTLTPGSVFGGEIGSGAYVDGKLIVVSNVGDPATNSPTNVTRVFALDPASGRVQWKTKEYPGKIFAPVSAAPGLAFIGTDAGLLAALDTSTGKQLWSKRAPNMVACGPSIVGGRVLWGYGFVLFGPSGKGGVLSFALP